MSESDNTQLAPVNWIEDKVQESLEDAIAALGAGVKNPDEADTTGLQSCHELVRQARGTLQMAQLQGALLLTEEMMYLLKALLANSEAVADRNQAYEALVCAMQQLPNYFTRLSGQADASVVVLPLINDIRAAYGEPAVVVPALLAPDFNGILPPDMPAVATSEKKDLPVLIKKTRHRIHRFMLGLFGGGDVEHPLNGMMQLYLQYCVTADSEPVKRFYWASAALCESIRDGGLNADISPVKLLLGQIDRQSKMIIDGGEQRPPPGPLAEITRVLLYYISCPSTKGEQVALLKTAFHLDERPPDSLLPAAAPDKSPAGEGESYQLPQSPVESFAKELGDDDDSLALDWEEVAGTGEDITGLGNAGKAGSAAPGKSKPPGVSAKPPDDMGDSIDLPEIMLEAEGEHEEEAVDETSLDEINSSLEELRDLMSSESDTDEAGSAELESTVPQAVLDGDSEPMAADAADGVEPELSAEAIDASFEELSNIASLEPDAAEAGSAEPEPLFPEAVPGGDHEPMAADALGGVEPEPSAEAIDASFEELSNIASLEPDAAEAGSAEPEPLFPEAVPGGDHEPMAADALGGVEPEPSTEAIDASLEELSNVASLAPDAAEAGSAEPEPLFPEAVPGGDHEPMAADALGGVEPEPSTEAIDTSLEELSNVASLAPDAAEAGSAEPEPLFPEAVPGGDHEPMAADALGGVEPEPSTEAIDTSLEELSNIASLAPDAAEAGSAEPEPLFPEAVPGGDHEPMAADALGGVEPEPSTEAIDASLEELSNVASLAPDAAEAGSAEPEPLFPEAVPGGDHEPMAADEDIGPETPDSFPRQAAELLASIGRTLDAWQHDKNNGDLTAHMRRDARMLQSGATVAGLEGIAHLSHAMETLLAAVVDGHVEVTHRLFDGLHAIKDELQLMHEKARDNGGSKAGAEALAVLRSLYMVDEVPPSVDSREWQDSPDSDKRAQTRVKHETVRVRPDLIDELVRLTGEAGIFRSKLERQSNSFDSGLSDLEQAVTRLQGQLKELDTQTQALSHHEQQPGDPQNRSSSPLQADRYSALSQLLSGLTESAGSLDNLRGMLGGLSRDSASLLSQLGRVNTELQHQLTQARAVPFAVTMAPCLRRIIRQTRGQLNKQVELKILGGDELVERHVLGRMAAPLEHILKNSIAHSIESPGTRASRGKPETGTVTVSVSREGGEVVIRTADDGDGFDSHAIRKKAESRGLIAENADMTDEQVIQLVSTAHFSAAAPDGVGMDVVNDAIKQLNGLLLIESAPGHGATITVRLPVSQLIPQALLVGVANGLYAIPLTSIEGVSRIDGEEAEKLMADKDSRYRHDGNDYQLSSMGELLGKQATADKLNDASPALVLVCMSGYRIAFYVDELLGQYEIVEKSPDAQLSSTAGVAGGTILDDGRVALIVDIPALMRMAGAELGHDLPDAGQAPAAEEPGTPG